MQVLAWFCIVMVFVIFVVISLYPRYVAWKVNKNIVTKDLPDGSVVIKLNNVYYMAVDKNAIPVQIGKDEGERLWALED